jgi:hypothetical protein
LEGIPSKDIRQEKEVVEMIFEGASNEEIMNRLRLPYISVRWKEIQELKRAGYDFVFDANNNSIIISLP